MAINFCTMPTQHNKLRYKLKFLKFKLHIYVCLHKISIIAMCYISVATIAFPGSAVIEQNYRDIQHTSLKKK
jgi:hypothetical protein